ncbi:MAG: host attachment protein [Halofilum sp. (in: g-proteobacteria)]|nr:host attachment protein [Halofilum sp. (in: g-proteobacteria)]
MEPIWVLVADGARARLFSAERPRGALVEHSEYANPSDRQHERDLVSDAPGRGNKAADGSRYAMEEPDAKKEMARRFARDLAEILRKGRINRKYARLYLVAPPAFLGVLRETLDDVTADHVVESFAKDFVQETPEAIRRHLPYRL